MAKNTFSLIGKIQLGKETEKFKPYKVNKSEKGWVGHRLVFGLKNVTGFHNLELFEGFMENGSSKVYCLKKKKDFNEETQKLQINWEDRLKPEIVEQVSDFNKMTVIIGDETYKYISGYDFLKHLVLILNDESLKDKKFKLKGDVVYQKYEGKIYRKLNPRYIELVSDETQEESILNLELYYTENAVDDQLFEDSQRYLVNTYISQYNWETKEEEYFEEPVIIDVSKATNELQQKAFNIIKNRFVINDEKVYRLGVKAVLLNGKEKRQITMEDLTEEERDLIECGLATLDEISAEYGNSINGESVNELKVVGFAYGYNKGNQETEIEVSKLLGVNTQDVLQDELFEEELNLDFNLPFA